jgi:hypothetical protein
MEQITHKKYYVFISGKMVYETGVMYVNNKNIIGGWSKCGGWYIFDREPLLRISFARERTIFRCSFGIYVVKICSWWNCLRILTNCYISWTCWWIFRHIIKQNKTPWLLVHKRSIPTKQPPLVDVVPTFAGGEVSIGQRNGSPWLLISVL